MNALANKIKQNVVSRNGSTKTTGNKPSLKIADNRTETVTQQKLQKMANSGVQDPNAVQLYSMANNQLTGTIQKKDTEEEELLQGKFKTIQKQGLEEEEELLQGKFKPAQRKEFEEEELLQGKFMTVQRQGQEEEELLQGKFITAQRKGEEEEELIQGQFEPIQKKENNTGLPDNLKSGIENLSGVGMDDVKVHYNSDKPSTLQAHAYAQGTDIHLAPGQEKHLPHEAWHVVQQKQGRVKPTMQLKGNVNVNDDAGLEKEADVMGEKAKNLTDNAYALKSKNVQFKSFERTKQTYVNKTLGITNSPIQRLALIGTNWGAAETAEASEGGAGGVIFVREGTSTLVVKPNIRGADELVAAHLQHEIAKKNAKDKSWGLGELKLRIADGNDVAALKQRILQLHPGLDLTTRLGKLYNNLASGSTLVQEAAPGGTKSFGKAMTDQVATGGHIARERKQKVKDESPLKPLFNKPEFAETLGRAAAADIFIGNFDRIAGLANIENMMINLDTKSLYLIDNIGANVSKDEFETAGDGQAEFNAWANHLYVKALKSGKVDEITKATWSFDGIAEMGTMTSMTTELIKGQRTDAEDKIMPFVTSGERDTLKAKFNRNNGKHLETIKKNFQKGIVSGLIVLAQSGSLGNNNGPLPPTTRKMYRARHNYLCGGMDAATAWQNA